MKESKDLEKSDEDWESSSSHHILTYLPNKKKKAKREHIDVEPNNEEAESGFPLSQQILDESWPQRWRQPYLDSYDGTTNPKNHLSYYKKVLYLQTSSDSVLAMIFLSNQKGAAGEWFDELP